MSVGAQHRVCNKGVDDRAKPGQGTLSCFRIAVNSLFVQPDSRSKAQQ
jgi:hypothetical protein